jgi:integrase/recombinase XerC
VRGGTVASGQSIPGRGLNTHLTAGRCDSLPRRAEYQCARRAHLTIVIALLGSLCGTAAFGVPGGIRTPDPLLRRQPLFPLSYRDARTRLLTIQKRPTILAGMDDPRPIGPNRATNFGEAALPTDPSTANLPSIRRLYELSLQAERLSPKTIGIYLEALDLLIEFLTARSYPTAVADVQRQHIAEFISELHRRGNTPATVNNRYRALRRFFNFAVEELGLPAGPMDRMKPPRLEEKLVRPLEPSQIEAMINACRNNWMGYRDAAILLVLYDTGLRAEECRALTLADLEGNRIVVRGKGSKERIVRLGHQAQMGVERYLMRRPFDSPALWLAMDGSALGETGLYQLVRRAGRRAGIPDAHPHQLRHSYAAQYLMGGGSRHDLQESLGHASDVITQRYVRFVAQEHALREHERVSPGDKLHPRRRR